MRCADRPGAPRRSRLSARHAGLLVALLATTALTACGGTPAPDNAAATSLIAAGASGEVTVRGPVTAVLPDGNGADGPHQRFDVDLGGVVVEVDHNLTLAPRVPVSQGSIVTIHGQLEPDPGRPVIHYTHHATGSHEGGWIELAGTRYD